jgi:LPS export ABC transporter protein LptC
MKWLAIILISIVVGGISLGQIRLSASPGKSVGLVHPISTDPLPDIHAQRVQVLAQTDSAANWKVTAEEAAFYNDGQMTMLRDVFMQYFRQASPLLQMSAAQGQIDNATGDIVVEGSVYLRYYDAYTIETRKMFWRALDRVLYTDLPVTIHNPLIHITGQELSGEVEQYRITLQGNIRASFQLR